MNSAEPRQDPLPHIPNLEEKLLRGLENPASPLTKSDWQNLLKGVRNRLSTGGRANAKRP